MTQSPPAPAGSEPSACPNCGSPNPPHVVVCPACGVRIDLFRQGKGVLDARQRKERAARRAEMARSAHLERVAEHQRSRQRLLRYWLPGVILTTLVLALPVSLIALNAGSEERLRREEVHNQLTLGEECARRGDYTCARSAYRRVLQIEPGNRTAQAGLWVTQVKLAVLLQAAGNFNEALELVLQARQATPDDAALIGLEIDLRIQQAAALAKERKWREALETLTTALALRPDDGRITAQMKTIYDDWIAYERAHGDFGGVLVIQAEKKMRFP